jgi:hypothetical protein
MRTFLLLIMMIGSTAAHAQQAVKPAAKLATYTNASWRWSISYPADWMLDSKDPDAVRVQSFQHNALCSIHSGPMDRFNTVDELTNFMLAHDEKFLKGTGQKFTVLSRRRITLPNGIVGNDILVEIGPGGRSRRIHVLNDGRGFALDCEGYARDWGRLEDSYQRVIASFTVARRK